MDERRQGRTLYTGRGVGGPADGVELVSRCPKGLLIVDKSRRLVYVYDFEPVLAADRGQFKARETDGRPESVERRFQAALEPDFDVISIGVLEEAGP